MIDLQETSDSRGIPLQQVGIRGYRHTVRIPGNHFPVVAEISFSVQLAETKRAIHMSRLIQILQEAVCFDSGGLEYVLDKTMREMQSESVRLEMCFPVMVKKISPVTEMAGEIVYDSVVTASKRCGEPVREEVEVTVPVTSVCPCSKAISAYGAHNQRGFVNIRAEGVGPEYLPTLIRYAEESASCPVYPLLKRPDEKHVTESGYDNPKFVEDIARDVATALRGDQNIRRFAVHAENMESIHSHNAYAVYQSEE